MSDDALSMRGPVLGTPAATRVAIGSSVGAVIETYDFIGFGTAAALYFGTAFFPHVSPVAGTLASFATLGVGFAARPLGGILGGHLGEHAANSRGVCVVGPALRRELPCRLAAGRGLPSGIVPQRRSG